MAISVNLSQEFRDSQQSSLEPSVVLEADTAIDVIEISQRPVAHLILGVFRAKQPIQSGRLCCTYAASNMLAISSFTKRLPLPMLSAAMEKMWRLREKGQIHPAAGRRFRVKVIFDTRRKIDHKVFRRFRVRHPPSGAALLRTPRLLIERNQRDRNLDSELFSNHVRAARRLSRYLSEHFRHNQRASVAALRGCSASVP